MIILFWSITILALMTCTSLLFLFLKRKFLTQDAFDTLKEGFKQGLIGCGFQFGKDAYTVELYKWVTSGDHCVCDDCRERATWPPMDIVDWMKVGLPDTEESHTECNFDDEDELGCRCQLVLVSRKSASHHKNKLS